MDKRFSNLDNTAPVQDPLNNPNINVPRSAFNFSCMKYFTGMIGAIMPFDVIETLPNEDYNISYDVLLKLRNPLVRPLLSGCRIYLHTYYNRMSDLWEGADNFVTKGRSGSISLSKPKLRHTFTYGGNTTTTVTPLSPSNFMGIPAKAYDSTNPLHCYSATTYNDDNKVYNIPDAIDALPFVMYQRLYRDKYSNKNLLQNNKGILPDNEDHFILPYECEFATSLSYDNPDLGSSFTSSDINLSYNGNAYIPSGSDQKPLFLDSLKFRQFKGDYFTSALPFPDLIRGTAPSINISDINASINWDNVFSSQNYPNFILGSTVNLATYNPGVSASDAINTITTSAKTSTDVAKLKNALSKATISGTANGNLNLNDFRALEAYTIFMERNARTDGDYDSLIKAQFGYNPNTKNREAYYIGGSYQDIVFSDVTQTTPTENSPLGSRAGQGISASSGYIGKFHSPDYGYIMTVMTIVPDNIYLQGTDRMWTKLTQSEQYFPILNNLSPQAILNKELFSAGTSADDDIYAYTERYSEYKSRQSKAMGLISLPHSKADYDASTIMARRFTNTPNLNNEFMTMSPDNIDMSVFSVADEPPFDLSVACRCDKVSPMPYITVPGGLSARA